ncbi:hypothetical protein VPH35_096700 [Triticum aestivum]
MQLINSSLQFVWCPRMRFNQLIYLQFENWSTNEKACMICGRLRILPVCSSTCSTCGSTVEFAWHFRSVHCVKNELDVSAAWSETSGGATRNFLGGPSQRKPNTFALVVQFYLPLYLSGFG